jgi:hypothetical protein
MHLRCPTVRRSASTHLFDRVISRLPTGEVAGTLAEAGPTRSTMET